MNHLFSNKVAVTALVTVISLGIYPQIASASELTNGVSVQGNIDSSTSQYPEFRTSGFIGIGRQTLAAGRGNEYTFTAKQGDRISITLDYPLNSQFKPALVLIGPDRRPIDIEEGSSLSYSITASGDYKVVVVARNNTVGSYKIRVSGLSSATTTAQRTPQQSGTPQQNTSTNPSSEADGIMRYLSLSPVGCATPGAARIAIGTELRCTKDSALRAGAAYRYNYSTRSLQLTTSSTSTNTASTSQGTSTNTTSTSQGTSTNIAATNQGTATTPIVLETVMKELGYTGVSCSTTNVAKITLDKQEFCTTELGTGNYTYYPATRSIRLTR